MIDVIEVLWWIALALAGLPAVMVAVNLLVYRRLPSALEAHADDAAAPVRSVSVLIPARDEAAAIGDTVQRVLASRDVDLELIVLDDGSTDGTADVARAAADGDPRLRVVSAPPLPAGWCGKQHACWQLAHLARHDRLVWIDVDVKLAPDALARLARQLDVGDAALISGFPRQVTITWMEKLVVSMIELILLGYLPMALSRRIKAASLGTGCGQIMAARRPAYLAAGGHAAIRASLHDGIKLPPVFRRAGYMTDLFDAGDLASCRMYRTAGEVWRGFAKNAGEAMAAPRAIVPWTVLLAGGFVLPWAVPILALLRDAGSVMDGRTIMLPAAISLATSVAVMWRARQSPAAGLLRPVGVLLLLGIQWYALLRRLTGGPVDWRGRRYPTAPQPAHAEVRQR